MEFGNSTQIENLDTADKCRSLGELQEIPKEQHPIDKTTQPA